MPLALSKKALCVFLLLIITFTVFAPITFADDIIEKVQTSQQGDSIGELEGQISSSANNFIRFLRTIAIIVAVIMFVLTAYSLLFSPDVRTISDCKGKVGALVAALFIAFMAEQIVATLGDWFGITF